MPENKKHLSRRDFLKIVATISGAAVVWRFGLEKFESASITTDSRILMGTVINLTLIGPNREKALEAISDVFARMGVLETVLSRFIPGGDLSKLNQEGVLQFPQAIFVDLLLLAQDTSLLTNGAFDVTVKPLIDVYEDRVRKEGGLPDISEIDNILPLIDFTKLHATSDRVWFDHAGMGATLDGIAKGYIVDQGVNLLREHGYTNVMMEAGGDLMALGERGTNLPWMIGIQAPRANMGELLAKIDLANKAIATSGDYMQPYSRDMRHHHIVNPHTGFSSPFLASATVIAPSCWQADALATALMVTNVQTGLALVKEIRDTDAILVTKDLKIISTLES